MRFRPQLYSRREFLRSGLALTAAAGTAPSFLTRTCLAVDNPLGLTSRSSPHDDPVLVVIQLSGGNDGLNTIIPYTDDHYFRLRPTLGIRAGERIRVTDDLAVHGALAPLQRLFDDGEFTWLQGVGYPNPNRSHFRSMEIWQTASDADQQIRTGWIGRFFDNTCAGAPSPGAVTIGREMPQAMRRETGHDAGIALDRPEHFAWATDQRGGTHRRQQRDMLARLHQSDGPVGGPAIDYLQHTALQAMASTDMVAAAERRYRGGIAYPNTRFGHDLQLIAKLIGGGVAGRVFYASIGGFDTHANQAGMHANLLTQLAQGLVSFRRDLVRLRQWERVAVMGFSEFGRRVDENGSQGTDHGAAGPMFVLGQGFRGGFFGEHPSLTDQQRHELGYHTDFRSVYATLLRQWMGADPEPVLGRTFPMINLLA